MHYRLPFLLAALSVLPATVLPAANVPPEGVQTLPTYTLARGSPQVTLDLDDYFRDPDVTGTAVRMRVRVGTVGTGVINIALFNAQTPLTVANFLAYINQGVFANNILHRSDPDFVLQGGGYYFQNNTTLAVVPRRAAIQNEPGISNVRGTIAMAKIGNDPDSATSEWFINLSNDNVFLDQGPPISNTFTVFGRVLDSSMAVVDAIEDQPVYDVSALVPGSGWTELPYTSNITPNATTLTRANLVETTTTVVPALAFTVTSSNAMLVSANISGNLLRFKPSAAKSGPATLTVTATDLEGATVQKTFSVTVLPPPTFTLHPPAGPTVIDGGTIALTATTTGGPPIYQWQRLPAGSRVWVDVTNGNVFSGATTAVLTITGATASMNGDQYRLRVTNGIAPAVTSKVSKLSVAFKPVVTAHPANAAVKAPAVATFKATATANPPPNFQWQMSTDSGATFTNLTNGAPFAGVTTGALKVTTNATLTGRQFRCVITNSAGSVTTNAATLTVTASPKFTFQPPATQTANAGGTVTLTFVATGNPLPTFVWKRNGVVITDTPFTSTLGNTVTTSFMFNPLLASHAGTYTVVASNGVAPAATSKAAKLVVNHAPVFTTQPPATVTIKTGKTVTIRTAATGLPKVTTYRWEFTTGQGQGGEPLFLPVVNGVGIKGATTASLTVTASPAFSGRKYRCIATNSIGSTTSNAATLSVTQ